MQYACSSDILEPFDNNIELDANDPRISMLMLMDSIKTKGSSVETLAIGESTEHYQQYTRVEVRGVFNDFDGYFTKDKPEVVNIDISKTVGVVPM